jgi:hypothetical protein
MTKPQIAALESDPTIDGSGKTTATPVKPVVSEVVGGKEPSVVAEVTPSDAVIPEDTEAQPIKIDKRQEIANKFSKEQRGYVAPVDENDTGNDDVSDNKTLAEDVPEPEMVLVKVNGLEKSVDKVKVDAAGGVIAYQKQAAADESMRINAETRRKLDVQATEIKAKEAEIAKREADLVVVADQREKNVSLAELAKKHREALFDGDEDAADRLMVEMMSFSAGKPATDKDIVTNLGNEVKKSVLEEITKDSFEKERKAAVDRFNTEHKDISSDPFLRQMAHSESGKIRTEFPDWTPGQIIDESVKRVNGWLDSKRGGKPTSDGTPAIDPNKIDDKRAISTPRAQAGRGTPATTGAKTETNAEYILRIKASRGLA